MEKGQMKRAGVVFLRQRLTPFIRWLKALCTFKSIRKGESGVREVKESSSSDEGNYIRRPLKFNATRRTGICSLLEEQGRRHGISLTELRRDLIVRHTLNDLGLL